MGQIQNVRALAVTDERRDALAIAEAGYAAINIGGAIERKLRFKHEELSIDDKIYRLAGRRIYFVGVGKCAFVAARAVEKLLGNRLAGGVALDVSPLEGRPLATIETYTGTHPLPSEANELVAKHIMEFIAGRREDDFVMFFISGGGSTLLCLHKTPMTCTDEGELFKSLTACAVPIQDVNTVRKHISLARGGALAVAAYPAEIVSLIVSDVPGDDLEFIASGPTTLDSTTVADAQAVLKKYAISPPTTIEFIETPKKQKYFERVTNTLFLSSRDALSAMHGEAVRRGYDVTIVDDRFTGEARDVGRDVAEKLRASPSKTVLLYAGESTVTLGAGAGAGGRNQEMALSALGNIRDDELILPFSSDGRDNTDHAGAISDETTRAHARIHRLSVDEHLNSHRSYDFFTTTGDAVVTGYTGSNVSDLIIALKK